MKGLLSAESIADANRSPICKTSGYARSSLDLGTQKPRLLIAGNEFCGPKVVIADETLFEIAPPERHSHRFRVSATFKNAAGKTVCRIVENEIVIGADNIDVVQTTKRFSIGVKGTDEMIELELQPPTDLHLKR